MIAAASGLCREACRRSDADGFTTCCIIGTFALSDVGEALERAPARNMASLCISRPDCLPMNNPPEASMLTSRIDELMGSSNEVSQ